MNLDSVASDGTITLFPREDCIRSIHSTALDMLSSNSCTPAAASKLRGKAGWASTNLFAKLGRIGLSALKDRQYSTNYSPLLNQELKEALQFLAQIDRVPPRSIDLRAPKLPPLVIYSDASWPSRTDGSKEITIPRIGWIIFDPLSKGPPRGFSTTVGDPILRHLIVREQQILAVEAFAAAAAPWQLSLIHI